MEKGKDVKQMKVILQFGLVWCMSACLLNWQGSPVLVEHQPLARAEKQQGETNRLFIRTGERVGLGLGLGLGSGSGVGRI